jgi:RHS repeat-associated protein
MAATGCKRARGRPDGTRSHEPRAGQYHVTDQYFSNGVVNTLVAKNSSSSLIVPTITYGVDGEGRLTTVSAGSGQNPVTAASYDVASQLTSMTLGSGDSDAYTYDGHTGRMTQYQFSINGSNVTGTLTWNPNGTLQQLAITDPFNSANAQNCSYQYDPIARLSQVNCGTTWGQSFSYDAYGNLTKTVLPGDSGLNWQPGYNNNNQYQLSGVSYDSDGNLLNDTFHTYTWSGLGDLTSIDGNAQYHDAFGRLVEWKDSSGSLVELMYSPAGAKIGMMTGQTLAVGRIPLPGGAIASYGSSGLNNYAHADWLGSTRFSSYTNRTKKWDLAHAPYGEVYALSGNGAEFTFTGQFSDTGNSNTMWDFLMREYHSSQGRWISPDSAGLAAINPMNPQTWNRYVYVGGNPLGATDPQGLDFSDAIGCVIGCGGGGVYAAPNFFQSQFDASNRNIDLSFNSWADWNARQTFGELYYDLPGHSNPIQQALAQYIREVQESKTPDELYLKATSDCSGTSGGDRTVTWMLMNTGGKDYWVFEHLDRPGRISGSGFGPQVSRDGPGHFEDIITAVPPFGVWNQTFTASRDPNSPNGAELSLFTSSNNPIPNDTIQQNIVQDNPNYVLINEKMAPSLAPCGSKPPG